MDKGTKKKPIPKFTVYWCFCPAEYGLYNTTQHPPPSHTLSVYTVHLLWEGGGEVREKVEGQQYTKWVENDWLYLQSREKLEQNIVIMYVSHA
jgi:hypothetical protein